MYTLPVCFVKGSHPEKSGLFQYLRVGVKISPIFFFFFEKLDHNCLIFGHRKFEFEVKPGIKRAFLDIRLFFETLVFDKRSFKLELAP